MGCPSLTILQIKPSNCCKAWHRMLVTFSPQSMGSLHFMVIFPSIFYKNWTQSLVPHNPFMKNYGKNGHIPIFGSFRRYFVTQVVVEGGIPRPSLWHYHEYGINLEPEWFNIFKRYLRPKEIWYHELKGCQGKFYLEVHCDYWLKLIEFYKPFREYMLNPQNA